MKSYQPSSPRAAFGVAALAITAVAFSLLVAAPASMEPRSIDGWPSMASKANAAYGIEVSISPARIEVVADRDDQLAQQPKYVAKQKQAV